MAWLGDNLKSWSSQITNVASNAAEFTRDVLAEGTTEVSDHETELKISEDKVQRLETIIISLKAENERLSFMNSELEEKAETSELQINSISTQYREMVQEKEPSFQVGEEAIQGANDTALKAKIKELQTKLQQEIDQSQHELSALQDAHHQKLSNLNRKHKSEIESYKEKIEELEEDLDLNTDESSASKHGDESKLKEKLSLVQKELERTKEELEETETSNASLQSEIEKLKLKDRQSSKQRTDFEGRIVKLSKEKEILNKEKEKLEQVSKDQTRALEKMEVRGSDDTTQKELEELRRLLEVREKELEASRTATEEVSGELLATKHRLLASLDDNHMEEGQRSVDDLEAASQEVQDETVDLISRMGEVEDDPAREEHDRLVSQVSRLQSELESLNAKCTSLTSDKEQSDLIIAKLNQDIQYLKEGKDLPSDLSSRTDSTIGLSTDGQSAGGSERSNDTNQAAGVEVNSDTQSFDGEFDDSLMFASIKQKYPEAASAMQEQLTQFEEIQKDWEMEKEALEQVVMTVRGQLKQKEQALKELQENQSQETSETEEMQAKVADLRQQLLTAESSEVKVKENLDMAIKEKERLSREMDQLQSKAETLSSKVSAAEREKDSLQQQLDESHQSLQHLTEELDRTVSELEEKNQSVLDVSQARDDLQDDLKQLDLQQEKERSHILESKNLLQREIDALKEENESLRRECEDRRKDVEENAVSTETSSSEVERLRSALVESTEKMDEMEREKDKKIEELKREVDVERESYDRLEESSTILTKCNKLLGEEKVALEEKLERMKSVNTGETSEVIAKMEEECEELKKHGDRLQEKCSELEGTLAKTQHEKITLREELSRKNNDLDKMSQRLHEEERKTKGIEETARKAESEKEKLENQIKEVEKKMREQIKHHEEKLQEVAESSEVVDSKLLSAEKEKHLQVLGMKDAEIEELRGICEELQLDLSGTKEALNTTVSNHEQLTGLLKEKESDIKSLADENAFFLEAVNQGKDRESELNIVEEKLRALESKFEAMEREKGQLEEKVAELQEIEQMSLDESRTLGLITDLEFEIGDLKKDLGEKELTIKSLTETLDKAKHDSESSESEKVRLLEDDLALKQKTILMLEEQNVDIKKQCSSLEEQLTSHLEESQSGQENADELKEKLTVKTMECEKLESQRKDLAERLKMIDQQVNDSTTSEASWKSQVEDLQREIDIYDESLKATQEKRTIQESKIKSLQQELENRDVKISQLSSEKDDMTKTLSEKENKTKQLQQEVDNLKNFVQSEPNGGDQIDGEENSFEDLQHLNNMKGAKVSVQSNLHQEPLAISDSEKQLEKMVQERDKEITTLKEQHQAAMNLLDDRSKTIMGNSVLVDLHKLQMQKKTLESERHQMVAVLNEKTKDCSNLKTEVHKLMKVVSAEKAALEKAQEDYKELQKSMQKPQNEMQKEALQNLSYLIQEKDLEIGALKQKNETLVQVLQTTSPNNSLEINKVLGDKEQLEKENKMLKEERDQLVVSIHQKHHESVAYYEEVQRLAGVINQESQKYIDLQKTVDGLNNEKDQMDTSISDFKAQLEEKIKLLAEMQEEAESNKQMFADFELQLEDMNQSVLSLEKEKENLQEELKRKDDPRGEDGSSLEDIRGKDEEIKELKRALEDMRPGAVQEEAISKVEATKEGTGSSIVEDIKDGDEEEEEGEEERNEEAVKEIREKEEEIERLKFEVDKLEDILADRNERINQKTNESLQKQSEVVVLRQQIDIQNQSLLEHQRVLQEKVRELEQWQFQCQEKDRTCNSLQSQLQNLSMRVEPLESETKAAKEESISLHHSVAKKDAENRSLQDMSNSIAMQLREKEFELEALKEKNKTLTQLVKERETGSQGDVERMLRETEAMQRQAQMFQQERDQVILMLQRNELDMKSLKTELENKTEHEKKLNSELNRLRSHLIEMEDTYMSEALQAEEREKNLRDRLTHAENNLRTNSSAVQSASQEASHQIENLLEQISSETNEKEQVLLELAASQEQCQQYSTSLGNLQMVLEQFQQEKEEMVAQEVEIYQKRAEEKDKIAEHLFRQNMEVQQKLSDTQDALESASRLTEQLDRKEETISRLRDEISRRDDDLNKYKKQFEEVSSAAETKVDKPLVRNLFINYVNAPASKKEEVSHLITSLLNFNEEELNKVGGQSSSAGWFGGIFGGSRHVGVTPPSTPRVNKLEKSFTQQFVRFLEEESTPAINVRMPVEEMTKERQKPPAFNPFSAPVPSHSPFIPSSPPAKKSLGNVGTSHLMVNPVPVGPSVPQPAMMTPVSLAEGGSGRNSPAAKASLRDILQ
ncbi:putative thyroid receptor-interacting protein 11 [Apostichopus japonicus]|uniref:Putative thyroid receptor-interacting protein 11 n=1 Tax=Stichopus japonicus TaxID=307972 RepID=A0A2G8JK86_STIJA|nr:putative thyroid receptor-interacting protein 11 [Apostichopus japonicus]